MVIQYKKKTPNSKWIKYKGKNTLKQSVGKYWWRLLNSEKTKVVMPQNTYNKIIKRFRTIEYFKHRGK